jgi:hypothetical protein
MIKSVITQPNRVAVLAGDAFGDPENRSLNLAFLHNLVLDVIGFKLPRLSDEEE